MTFRLNSNLSETNILQNHLYIDPNPNRTTLKAWFIDGTRQDQNPIIAKALGFTYCEMTLDVSTEKLNSLTSETVYELQSATWSKKTRLGVLTQVKYPISLQTDGIEGHGTLHCVAGVGVSQLEVKNVLFNLGQEISVLNP